MYATDLLFLFISINNNSSKREQVEGLSLQIVHNVIISKIWAIYQKHNMAIFSPEVKHELTRPRRKSIYGTLFIWSLLCAFLNPNISSISTLYNVEISSLFKLWVKMSFLAVFSQFSFFTSRWQHHLFTVCFLWDSLMIQPHSPSVIYPTARLQRGQRLHLRTPLCSWRRNGTVKIYTVMTTFADGRVELFWFLRKHIHNRDKVLLTRRCNKTPTTPAVCRKRLFWWRKRKFIKYLLVLRWCDCQFCTHQMCFRGSAGPFSASEILFNGKVKISPLINRGSIHFCLSAVHKKLLSRGAEE